MGYPKSKKWLVFMSPKNMATFMVPKFPNFRSTCPPESSYPKEARINRQLNRSTIQQTHLGPGPPWTRLSGGSNSRKIWKLIVSIGT